MFSFKFLKNPLIFWLVLVFLAFVVFYSGVNFDSFREDLFFSQRLNGVSFDFPLGIDAIGRDYSQRVIRAFFSTLFVGFAASFFAVGFAIFIGLILVISPRLVKNMFLVLIKLVVALPSFLLLIALALFLDQLDLFNNSQIFKTALFDILRVALVIGLSHWGGLSLIIHESWQETSRSEFVKAAHLLGGSSRQIFIAHGIRAMRDQILIYFIQAIPTLIVAETMLSFLSLGLREPNLSLGGLIIDGIGYLQKAPHLSLAPACFLGVIMLSFSYFRKLKRA